MAVAPGLESWESEADATSGYWMAGSQRLAAVSRCRRVSFLEVSGDLRPRSSGDQYCSMGSWESEVGESFMFGRAGSQKFVRVLCFGELGVRSW